jgi:energy-coupling factor transporter ATP-binding protein EcfA2
VFGLENLQVPVDGILARAETSLRTAGLWERRAENPEHQVLENTVWEELTYGLRLAGGPDPAGGQNRHLPVGTALSTPLWPRDPGGRSDEPTKTPQNLV